MSRGVRHDFDNGSRAGPGAERSIWRVRYRSPADLRANAPTVIAGAVHDPGEQVFPGQTTAGHAPDWSLSLAVRDANWPDASHTAICGSSTGELTYGDAFILEARRGGQWQALPYIADDFG